jgi:hypothetical protein
MSALAAKQRSSKIRASKTLLAPAAAAGSPHLDFEMGETMNPPADPKESSRNFFP